jgi:hypothetical protein
MIFTAVAFIACFLTVLRAMPDGNILTGMLILSSGFDCRILGSHSGVYVIRNVTPYRAIVVHRRFGGTTWGSRSNCSSYLARSSTLKREAVIPLKRHWTYTGLQRRTNTQIKTLRFTYVIKIKNGEWRFESHPKTLPRHLHTDLRAVATVHIGKSTE